MAVGMLALVPVRPSPPAAAKTSMFCTYRPHLADYWDVAGAKRVGCRMPSLFQLRFVTCSKTISALLIRVG